MEKLRVLVIALMLVLFGFLLGSAVFPGSATNSQINLQLAETLNQLLTESERIYADIYNRVSPSVVSINIATRHAGTDLFVPESLGTGFVLDKQGHIATNYHVVEGADRIEVNFFDGTITRAEVIGLDADSDLAVIKVDLPEDRLQPVTFANSDELIIGQQALALGSPFSQRWTLTTGIISALDRRIDGLGGYSIGAAIQTDAAINPGNSGGPLLSLQGQVIGVNSQIISQSRSNSGVGFAIPSNLVKRVVQDLITQGRVSYSYLGISGGDVTLDLIEQSNLPNNLRGVPVSQVVPNGPAASAGVQNGDIITAINNVPTYGFNQLIAYLSINTRPGDLVNLTVLRNGQQISLPLTLGQRP